MNEVYKITKVMVNFLFTYCNNSLVIAFIISFRRSVNRILEELKKNLIEKCTRRCDFPSYSIISATIKRCTAIKIKILLHISLTFNRNQVQIQ